MTYTDNKAVHIDKDQSKGRMLDIYAYFGEFISGHSYLHWGYWNDPDSVKAVTFVDFVDAQKAFLDKLISFIPDGVHSVLDIGSGTGELAKLLQDKGYDVACVCPSLAMNDLARRKLAAGTRIYESRFEDTQLDGSYDLAVFCESFQYVTLPDALDRLANRAQYVLIMDHHKLSSKSIQGSGFSWPAFEKAFEEAGYEMVAYEDITANVKLTHEIKRRFYLEFCPPVIETICERLRQKHPILSRFYLGALRKRLFDVDGLRRKGRKSDPEKLAGSMVYCILLLKKKA